ncbi:acyl-CoA synthetase FdrA [Streptomyces puniciscabiei]
MSTREHQIHPNLYKDSVALMAISATLARIDGIAAASVVMATPTNLENLRDAGLGELDAGPNDLVIAVSGDEDACAAALQRAAELLTERPDDGPPTAEADEPLTSLQLAYDRNPGSNLALISVPGPYAAAEALKALRLGMHVMVFSDNVPVEQEIEVKRYADSNGLLVMGPDCGTAIVNGTPLGFANVVRRGRIGVVGASGTGIQEVTSRIHQHGEGISQALGTGGHDLSAEVGGISMLRGLRALAEDDATEVVVLISKPPSEAVAKTVVEEARTLGVPTVVGFLGSAPAITDGDTMIHRASTLAHAADIAVALARGTPPPREATDVPVDVADQVRETAARFAPGQRYLRGVFSGGTFCYEAQLLCRAAGIAAWSNTPVHGNQRLDDVWMSSEHTILDMGDDAFTRGRPHPMIDPAPRDERLLAEAADPGTAVLLFDVVLGYGAAADPVAGLLPVLDEARARADCEGRTLGIVAHVCGTDDDPQGRSAVVERLRTAGVLVAEDNTRAALTAARLVVDR